MIKSAAPSPSPLLRTALIGGVALMLAGALAPTAGLAQSSRGEAVVWTAQPAEVAKGGKAVLVLRGEVQPGWHLYGLKQAPTGPNALRVAVEQNDIATASGAATASAPVKELDRAFGVETQFYDKPFTLSVPVRVGSKPAAGAQQIPVSVRYQTCNGDICQPPKTVRVNVPVSIKAG